MSEKLDRGEADGATVPQHSQGKTKGLPANTDAGSVAADPEAGSSNKSGTSDVTSNANVGPKTESSGADISTSGTTVSTGNTSPDGGHRSSTNTGSNTSGNGAFMHDPEVKTSGTGNWWRDRQEQETHEELLNQFYATLEVMYLAAQPFPGGDVPTTEQHKRIRELFKKSPRTWMGAYEIEQLLAFVMTDDQVTAELPRRLAEAEALKLKFVTGIKTQIEDATQPNTEKRYILQRLLNDLQWFYMQRIRRRNVAKRLSIRVSALFFSAFLIFFILLFSQLSSNPNTDEQNEPRGQNEKLG